MESSLAPRLRHHPLCTQQPGSPLQNTSDVCYCLYFLDEDDEAQKDETSQPESQARWKPSLTLRNGTLKLALGPKRESRGLY